MIEKRYTIGDLERLTNTKRRTIHFYVQLGLIPRPDNRGGAASYSEEALERLNLIKELKKQRLTLNEIREFFENKDKQILASTHNITQLESREFSTDSPLINYSFKLFNENTKLSNVTRESVIRMKLADGIDIYIDKETYKKYQKYIKKGLSKFLEVLSERKKRSSKSK